ncbi:hypothetical protein [Aquimarina celericrescens]|uniref:Uncharacterized protein n=1 Tax=Aquimarina celericrescens TaxID=1964542 RepID=A0ABW5AYN0_9FLAO|nr:hypothetical protein [Aquimarina celericrescens]
MKYSEILYQLQKLSPSEVDFFIQEYKFKENLLTKRINKNSILFLIGFLGYFLLKNQIISDIKAGPFKINDVQLALRFLPVFIAYTFSMVISNINNIIRTDRYLIELYQIKHPSLNGNYLLNTISLSNPIPIESDNNSNKSGCIKSLFITLPILSLAIISLLLIPLILILILFTAYQSWIENGYDIVQVIVSTVIFGFIALITSNVFEMFQLFIEIEKNKKSK